MNTNTQNTTIKEIIYMPPINISGIIKYTIPNYPTLREKMGIVIGQNGRNFKLLSHYADVKYIWYVIGALLLFLILRRIKNFFSDLFTNEY